MIPELKKYQHKYKCSTKSLLLNTPDHHRVQTHTAIQIIIKDINPASEQFLTQGALY
jgi:hypothetical protein